MAQEMEGRLREMAEKQQILRERIQSPIMEESWIPRAMVQEAISEYSFDSPIVPASETTTLPIVEYSPVVIEPHFQVPISLVSAPIISKPVSTEERVVERMENESDKILPIVVEEPPLDQERERFSSSTKESALTQYESARSNFDLL